MTRDELVAHFSAAVPSAPDSHIMWWVMDHLLRGNQLPFMEGLLHQLGRLEKASPGYAAACISKIAAIPNINDHAREALYQIVGEMYCATGAIDVADHDENGVVFVNEPFATEGLMNPEFESQYAGISYAVEVKTPGLISYRRQRATNNIQINTRLPGEVFAGEPRTLPRDNPVKDFLLSANMKFAAYETRRPGAFHILSIVWDDFVYEPIAALQSPVSGLFTEQSFHRHSSGSRETYPKIDGVVIIPYQRQILRTFGNQDDAEEYFLQYRGPAMPKAFIQCPDGRPVPKELLAALDAVPLADCMGAEYRPQEIVFWTGD